MARPFKEINWDLVEKMIEAGSPAKEIWPHFGLCADTFYDRFKIEYGCNYADYSAKVSCRGEGNLRLMLHSKAMQGNLSALTLFGKTRLGLREPDNIQLVAATQPQIDQSQRIMELEHEVAVLKENANKPKAE